MTTVSIATRQVVPLDLIIDEVLWSGKFDRLEVWRSRTLEAGPYEQLTDDFWRPARVPEVAGEPGIGTGPLVNLAGRTLNLKVNELIDIAVTFTGPDPLTFAEAAAQITTAALGLLRSFVLSNGLLVVETSGTGLHAIGRVVGGDAAPLLGLPTEEPDSLAFGRDARLQLFAGQSRYAFDDPNGASSYFYRTRFFNSTTRETSEFGAPFPATPIARLSAARLVRGTVDLVDASGNPVANRAILLDLELQATPVEQRTLVPTGARAVTDANGHAEFMLARGMTVTVSVAGTALSRRVVVPTDPEIVTLNLLDPAYGSDDLFAVQRPNIPFAARRSL